jgi:hypothetical protein
MSLRAILSAGAAAWLLAAASPAPAWAGHGGRHGVAGGHHAAASLRAGGYGRRGSAGAVRAGHHHRHAFFPRHGHWRGGHFHGGVAERRFFPRRFHRAWGYATPGYVAFPPSGWATVAGATAQAPLYNRPGPICF